MELKVLLSILLVSLPASTLCRRAAEKPRIVGGVPAITGKYPHAASYFILGEDGEFKFACGASIITNEHVLSAAHCVEPGAEASAIRAGSLDRETGGQYIKVKKIFTHPEFTLDHALHDIAVFKLIRPLRYTRSLRKIALPPVGYVIPENVMLTVVGWGRLGEKDDASHRLMSVQLRKFNHEKCALIHSQFENVVKDQQICAGGEQGKDSCAGDSGGGLVYNNYIVGVVSYGEGCARKGIPGVYTEVTKYLPWIQEQLAKK